MKQMTAGKMRKCAVVMILLGTFFLIGLLRDVTSWKMFYKDPVTVQATVVRNTKHSQRNGQSYTVYVDYEYGGVNVTDKAVENEGLRESPAEIGSQIALTVDGNAPEKQLKDPGADTLIFGALTFFMAVFGVLMFRSAKNYPEY